MASMTCGRHRRQCFSVSRLIHLLAFSQMFIKNLPKIPSTFKVKSDQLSVPWLFMQKDPEKKFLISLVAPSVRTHMVLLFSVPVLVSGPAAQWVLVNSQRAEISIMNILLNYWQLCTSLLFTVRPHLAFWGPLPALHSLICLFIYSGSPFLLLLISRFLPSCQSGCR